MLDALSDRSPVPSMARGMGGARLRPLPVALALALLLAGFGGGWWVRSNSRPAAQDSASEIAELREEVHATRQLVVLSMLRLQSANDRLQGVSYGRQSRGSRSANLCGTAAFARIRSQP